MLAHEVASGKNLSDLVVPLLEAGRLSGDQCPALYSTLLLEKFNAVSKSLNLPHSVALDAGYSERLASYPTLDLNALYFHSSEFAIPFNPKNRSHLDFLELEK